MVYTRMDRGTVDDYALDMSAHAQQLALTAEAVLGQLQLLKGETGGAAIDRYEHSLQTATRALRDHASDELVVAALLHDVGDVLAPSNHDELAAAILKPYVSEQTWWVVQHHGTFQGYYFFHHVGGDRYARDAFRGHPHFAATVRFCDRWDMRSFDPLYDSDPLEAFVPLVRSVFSRPTSS